MDYMVWFEASSVATPEAWEITDLKSFNSNVSSSGINMYQPQ
jgi:hypothetical protein